MTMPTRFRPLAAAVVLAAGLAGCTTAEDRLGSVLVAPGKYVLFTCPELIQRQKEIVVRQRDLEALMAKAGQDSGGRFVSMMAYETDYASGKADLRVVRQEAAEKQCQLPDPYATPAPAAPPPVAKRPAPKPKR